MRRIVGLLCPRGHRVQRQRQGRLWCGTCRRTLTDKDLIPVDGKVRRLEAGAYARGYHAGYERGCADTAALLKSLDGGSDCCCEYADKAKCPRPCPDVNTGGGA